MYIKWIIQYICIYIEILSLNIMLVKLIQYIYLLF